MAVVVSSLRYADGLLTLRVPVATGRTARFTISIDLTSWTLSANSKALTAWSSSMNKQR